MSDDELHLMIDIETLGTRPDAAILSVGAVVFAPFAEPLIRGRFFSGVALDSAMAYGTIDAATLRWWITQPTAAFRDAFDGSYKLETVLTDLAEFRAGHRALEFLFPVWANGPAFDLVILEHAYRRCGSGLPPWVYHDHRCCRTLKAAAAAAPVPERAGLEHHALADAEYQAACVAARLRWLARSAQALAGCIALAERMAPPGTAP